MTNAAPTTGPESIVVSLEWAKKLKERGWSAEEGLFRWVISEGISQLSSGYIVVPNDDQYAYDSTDLPAPTAEEVLRKLPTEILAADDIDVFDVLHCDWSAGMPEIAYGHERCRFKFHSLANAAAACWAYLKEHHLLPDV